MNDYNYLEAVGIIYIITAVTLFTGQWLFFMLAGLLRVQRILRGAETSRDRGPSYPELPEKEAERTK